MSEKKIYSNKLKKIVEDCPECRNKAEMNGTGYLIYSDLSNDWVIEYKCQKCNEIIRKWDLKYEDIIKEVLKENGIE